ncbi:MAG: ABC transporter substrate-binding protein [Treponemataceae bacterium]|nr:ABC transporter substrate-binding protein [Treponemataceae bacterium]
MKKVLATLLVVALACSMVFAGGKKESAASAKKTITVGYAQVGAESDWRLANTESFKTTFVAENGYELIFVDAQQKQENQIKAMRNFIQQDVDYIVVAPVVETGWETVLTEAKNAGIPVILSDRMMTVSDPDLYLCWVGGNFVKEGRDGVKWLEGYLAEKGRANDQINIVDLQGTIGSSAQIGRTQGLEEGVAAHANWNMVAQQSGDFTQDGGQKVMEAILKSVGADNIDVVYAENDNMAWGAIDAIRAAGKVPGKDIIIICFDAVHESFNRMIAGEINCAVECNPLHGPRVAEIIQDLENGVKPEKIMYVVEEVFDEKNAAERLPTRAY